MLGEKKAYQLQALLPSGAYFAAQNINVAVRSRIDLGACVRGGVRLRTDLNIS